MKVEGESKHPASQRPPAGGADAVGPTGTQDPLSQRPRPVELSFLGKLNRRNVVRVGALYLVISWLILEPVHVVFHMLEVPAWANRLVILVMAVGLPAVLIFAWAYEITPAGLKPSGDVDPRLSITHQTGRRLDKAIIAVLAVALAYFIVDKVWLSKARTHSELTSSTGSTPTRADMPLPDRSIAVLPFVDMSAERDQEYFSDGLSEELIDLLSRTPALRVVARTSSFQFKGKNEDMRSIASKLGVANLLEGSVRKSGRMIRVTAQLIKATDGSHLWSETYDRELKDIFRVQDEVCGMVAQALRLALLTDSTRSGSLPRNLDAYNTLLQGKYLAERGTRDDEDRAIALFLEATRLEPTYARAWADLAETYLIRSGQGWGVAPEVGQAQARSAVERALQLDPTLPTAHRVLGDILQQADWDWAGAQREYARAQQVDPDSAATLARMANSAAAFGRLDDAIALQQQLLIRDPLSARRHRKLATYFIDAGRFGEAEAALRKSLELNPEASATHYFLAMAFLGSGRNAQALAEIQRETDDAWRKTGLPFVYFALGRRAAADAALETLKTEYAYSSAFNIAEVYAYQGEKKPAFGWLDRALRQRDAGMLWLKTNAHFKDLRDDPRYRALLKRLNLPE